MDNKESLKKSLLFSGLDDGHLAEVVAIVSRRMRTPGL